MRLCQYTLVVVAFVSAAFAQEATFKLHPRVVTALMEASPTTQVPVYFVMREQLGMDHWFPRMNRMPVEERRATVMRECQEHSLRTQAETLAILNIARLSGTCEFIEPCWLGNFVRCIARPDVILDVAALESVEEVWSDVAPLLHEVEDGVMIPSGTTSFAAVSGAIPSAAGNGPINTSADQVWAVGFNGTGVVVMNTDSGINAAHNDLLNRLWQNPGEIAANGIDDDGNGKIDDINGWNFSANNISLSDAGGHGTNTAGCLVADGTCNGTVYGQAPGAKIMTGLLGSESSQWAAIAYGIAEGAHCQTSSHSYKNVSAPNYKMHRQVGDTSLAAGLIRTNSTSNNGTTCTSTTSLNRRPFNISAPGCLPAPYVDPNQTLAGGKGGVIGVAAHDLSNNILSYSPCGPFAWHLTDVLAVNASYPVANWDAVNHNDYPWTGATQMALLKPDVSAPAGTTTPSGSGTCGTATFSGTSNATPVANGVLCLWKSANMSLTPEDAAMITHQTATSSGSVAGKENNHGAGRINALNGLRLALCVHRVNGEPAWNVNHPVNTSINLAVDGVPNSIAVIGVGSSRLPGNAWGGVVGIGDPAFVLMQGTTDAAGDMSLDIPIPAALTGLMLWTQAFVVDSTYFNAVLSSNVIGITFVP
ncbi:MAG: hypothetical protein EXS14_08155 [Planctomycetes bacterium]|nr:hypothetical protein [Planctomycetota bacterium]